MGFVMVRVEVAAKSDSQLNALVKTDAHAGVQELVNLLQGCLAGTTDATIAVATRETTEAISTDGNGTSATYELK